MAMTPMTRKEHNLSPTGIPGWWKCSRCGVVRRLGLSLSKNDVCLPQEQPEEEISCANGNHIVKSNDSTQTCVQCGHRSAHPKQEQWMELVEILNNLITDYSFQHDDKELEPLKSFIKSQLEAAEKRGREQAESRNGMFADAVRMEEREGIGQYLKEVAQSNTGRPQDFDLALWLRDYAEILLGKEHDWKSIITNHN